MEQVIIGISGKKQSGKDTTANYLMEKYNGDSNNYGHCKTYSFADKLKMDVCCNLLGLEDWMCYGTDEQKNQLTHLKWEDMPGVITPEKVMNITKSVRRPLSGSSDCNYAMTLNPGGPKNGYWTSIFDQYNFVTHEPGQMTAREVMQYVGTEIFRKMYKNVWCDSLIRQIKEERYSVAIIADMRFPDEAKVVSDAGGYLWRFTRQIQDDEHESETALDSWGDWDFYLDNQNMSLDNQLKWCEEEFNEILEGKKTIRELLQETK